MERTEAPSLLSASACFLALVFLGYGCGGANPAGGASTSPEPEKTQEAISAKTLKRTPLPNPGQPPPAGPASLTTPAPALEFEPAPLSLASIMSEKGEAAYRQEDYRLAEKRFREALVHDSKLLHALTGLGWTLYDSERPDEAFLYFERAKNLYPKSGSAQRGFAYLLYRYGRLKEARALLGSLDKARWPELANIDEELTARAAGGLPVPGLPTGARGREKPERSYGETASLAPTTPQPKLQPEPKPEPETKTAKTTLPDRFPGL